VRAKGQVTSAPKIARVLAQGNSTGGAAYAALLSVPTIDMAATAAAVIAGTAFAARVTGLQAEATVRDQVVAGAATATQAGQNPVVAPAAATSGAAPPPALVSASEAAVQTGVFGVSNGVSQP